MCNPALIMMGMGTGLQALGSFGTATATKGAAEFNAASSLNQASDAITRGNKEVVRARMRTKSLKGKQRAAMAANGVALDEGTALDIIASTDVLSEMDELTIIENAEREAKGFRTRAALSRATAENISPLLAGAAPLLSGAGQVASKWYDLDAIGAL